MYKILIGLVITLVLSYAFFNYGSYYNEKEIRLGMSGPFSGTLSSLGEELEMGASIYFKHINEQGGINGRFFRLIIKDDKYEPRIAAENAIDFIEKYKVFAFLGFVGTETSKAVLPIVNKYRIPYIGAFSGAGILRKEPRNSLILNGRTSYEKEIEELIKYYVDEKHYEKIGVFYQNDSYGRSGLKGVKEALKKRDMKLSGEGSYKRNTLAVSHALYEISHQNPEVVIMIGATKPTAEFIKRAREHEPTKNLHFGIVSFVDSSMLMKELDEKAKNIVFSQVVPSPWGSLSKEVRIYRKLMDKYNPRKDYSYVSLEGYFVARMTVELFKRVGKKFTKEDFIDEMRNLYLEIERSKDLDQSKRICKCLNNVYLTRYDDGIFWDLDEE